jgi:hypothetical protein
MYQMHRVFCATAWELEGERRAFYDLIGEFNEAEAMPQGILYVPVSLLNMADKRPFTYVIQENIRDSRHYLLVPGEDWGPVERNFRRDYQYALQCAADPKLPMRDVAILLRRPLPGEPAPDGFPPPDGEFDSIDEFKQLARRLFSRWLAALLTETPTVQATRS